MSKRLKSICALISLALFPLPAQAKSIGLYTGIETQSHGSLPVYVGLLGKVDSPYHFMHWRIDVSHRNDPRISGRNALMLATGPALQFQPHDELVVSASCLVLVQTMRDSYMGSDFGFKTSVDASVSLSKSIDGMLGFSHLSNGQRFSNWGRNWFWAGLQWRK